MHLVGRILRASKEKILPEFKVCFFDIFKKDGRMRQDRSGAGGTGFRSLELGPELGRGLPRRLPGGRWGDGGAAPRRRCRRRGILCRHRPPARRPARRRCRAPGRAPVSPAILSHFPFSAAPRRERSCRPPCPRPARPVSPPGPLPAPAHLPSGRGRRRLPSPAGPQQRQWRRQLQLQPRDPPPPPRPNRRGPEGGAVSPPAPAPPARRPARTHRRADSRGVGRGRGGDAEGSGRAVTAPSFPSLRLPVRAAPREGAGRTRGGRREGPAGS